MQTYLTTNTVRTTRVHLHKNLLRLILKINYGFIDSPFTMVTYLLGPFAFSVSVYLVIFKYEIICVSLTYPAETTKTKHLHTKYTTSKLSALIIYLSCTPGLFYISTEQSNSGFGCYNTIINYELLPNSCNDFYINVLTGRCLGMVTLDTNSFRYCRN